MFAASITRALSRVRRIEAPRNYIGASIAGDPCSRLLFYANENAPTAPNEAQSLRIFDFGNAVEALAVQWLRAAGFYVYERSPATGEQFRVTADTGTLGHLDGVISDCDLLPGLFGAKSAPHAALLEVKSHKGRKFNEVANLGVKSAMFMHYVQMQCYLGSRAQIAAILNTAQKLDTCIYVAINKDTCEIYIEEVPYDKETFLQILSRIRAIKSASSPPPRIKSAKTDAPCKWCNYQIHCFNDKRATSLPKRACNAGGGGNVVPLSVSKSIDLRHTEWGL